MDGSLPQQSVVQEVIGGGRYPVFSPFRFIAMVGTIIALATGACQTAAAQTSEWVWMGGSNAGSPSGVYGTIGVAAAGNIPGAREDAFTWTDASGNLWLFGGKGKDSVGTQGDLNDLWEFNPSTNMWTWMGGNNMVGSPATYGTQGVPSTANSPGCRDSGVAWTDKDGNLWLFGGYGWASGQQGYLNELWEYSPSTREWTWVSGGKTVNSTGSYGMQGVASATNVPSAREGNDSGGVLPGWTDSDGNLWLFGGEDANFQGLNDLWEFSPASGMWTWVTGSNTENATGVYGPQGVAGNGFTPSARKGAQAWKDKNGNFWLHGGYAQDVACAGSNTYMCVDSPEMWEFNPVTKEWAWISGQDSSNTAPVYGTQGAASGTSNPGGREMAATWVDPQGNLWLFGGYTFDGQANNAPDDLWMYNITTSQWTWVGGSSGYIATGYYGALGVPSASNWPESEGIEGASATWVDAQGNLWLFSGANDPNDMWVYHASPAATPTFSAVGASVTITDITSGATIHYTTDGTFPTALSPVYSTPLTVSSNETVEAVAIAPGYPISAMGYYGRLAATTTIVTTPTNEVYANFAQVLFAVAVIGAGSDKPTGTVVLWHGSENLGSAAIDSSGKATLTVGTLSSSYCANCMSVGEYPVTAVYSGDSNNAGSTSEELDEVVELDPTSTAVSSSANSAPLNSLITFTATVTLEHSNVNSSEPPTGTITFKDGSTVIGTGTLTSAGGLTGIATLTTSSLGVGTHSITAVYGGDSVNEVSTATAFTQTVSPSTPSFSISNSGAITAGQGITANNTSTITVTPANGFTGTVALSCSVTTALANAISPVTCSIPPSVGITGSGAETATLTANSTSTTTTGSYAITVTAQSGNITQTTVVNVTVNPAPGFTSASGGTTSMAVTAGSTTGNTGTVDIVETNGFSGTVNLSCSVTTMNDVNYMPTCSLNPTSVSLSGSTVESSTFTVNTTAATSADNRKQTVLWPSAGGSALALVMFLVLPRARRMNYFALLGMFIVLSVIGVSGCSGGNSGGTGGGGGGATSRPGTTAGTYTVTVTGTGTSSGSSSSFSATVGTVTLTVN